MRYLLLLGILVMNTLASYSQKPDTTIFDSGFEKKVFYNYSDSLPIKPIDILIAFKYVPGSATIEKTIETFCNTLESKGISKLNRKKQIKEIYDQVHNRFLKKYEEETYFNDIFTNGNFNCVTASALYALVLDYFKIEYSIKETPNHVYLLADPKGTSFLIETTLPTKGIFQFDEKFKKNYIDYLHSNKIISETEYKFSSTDDLFQKHYESAKTISSIQLAALQYYNKGVFSYSANDYSTAAINLEKANTIYPSPNIRFLYSNAVLLLIVEQTGKKKYEGKTLAKYTNLNSSSPEALQMSKEHFKAITNEMVINRPDLKAYTIFYNDLITSLNDSIDKSDYAQVYHEMMAYYFTLKNNYEKVLYHSTHAYQVNPENIRTQQLVLQSLMEYLQEDDHLEVMSLDTMVNYSRKLPFLLENNTYIQMLAFCFGKEILNSIKKLKDSTVLNALSNLQLFTFKLKDKQTAEAIIIVLC